MATLLSPGTQITVTDESFYSSSTAGTIPLFVIATASNKASPSGDGTIAPQTVPSQAGVLFLASSQRELIQAFGNPVFQSSQGTQLHGNELNEYGLHAAYQFLGISNRAYVMRADLDLNELQPSVSAPTGDPVNGTYWFDLTDTAFGVFQSSGASSLDPFLKKNVTIVSTADQYDDSTGFPASSFGEDGDVAVVVIEATNRIFEKINTVWYLIGSDDWKMHRNIITSSAPIGTVQLNDSFSINGVTVVMNSTAVNDIVSNMQAAIAGASSLAGKVQVSADSAGRITINHILDSLVLANVTGTPLTALNFVAGTYKGVSLTYAAHNKVPQGSVQGDIWIKTTNVNNGANYVVKVYSDSTGVWTTVAAPFYANDFTANSSLGESPASGTLYVEYNPEGTDDEPLAGQIIRVWTGSAWENLSYEQSTSAPSTSPAEGTFWYNQNFQVDIMVGDGDQWLGYRKMYPQTDAHGVIIAGSKPTTQINGNALVDNDLWLDSSDQENYPMLYRYTAATRKWTLIDNTDQTTPYGIVFKDARADSGPAYTGATNDYVKNSTKEEDMVLSNYLDPDAPDPRTYSLGTLLFNTRYSTNNVKVWKPNYFNEGGYDANTDFTQSTYTVGLDTIEFPAVADAGRWVTDSGNKTDGSPYMGRKAQRAIVVRELSSILASNEELRSEVVYFNTLATPGYPECIDEMITLNTDKKEVAFIVGDTPARLAPSSTAIQAWATNSNNAVSNGDDGLTSASPYVGLYYPWGLSTNVDGTEIMVPPSTIAMRTIAYNDQVSYPWMAPAGFTRGLVSNAASVGYLTSEGEYSPVILNEGQRDTLYTNNINPIAYIPNRGLVVYGQKTLYGQSSKLDRINVARLINYIRYNLDNTVKPFLFEPNDQQTRDAAKSAVERFLANIVGLRGLEDFAVLCDETNNTADRRNRNELWIDIAIIPESAIEFIYVPIRVRSSGSSLSLS